MQPPCVTPSPRCHHPPDTPQPEPRDLDGQLRPAAVVSPGGDLGVGDARRVPQLLVDGVGHLLVRLVLLLHLEGSRAEQRSQHGPGAAEPPEPPPLPCSRPSGPGCG